MATSGTTTFNLELDDIIQDAYERCGLSGSRTGYQLQSARRSLNLLLSEWGNRGVHIWKVTNHTQNLTASTTTYTAPSDASDVLEMVFRNGSTGLAYFLSQKISPERTQALKLYYEDEMQRALTEDSQSTSVHIVPQNYFVSG